MTIIRATTRTRWCARPMAMTMARICCVSTICNSTIRAPIRRIAKARSDTSRTSTASKEFVMNEMDQARRDLVIANRILAREDVVDAYGHVSMRHPQDPGRYLLSWSRSPELVEEDDIIEFTLDGKPVKEDGRPPYLERFIHGAIYEARPEVQAVIHSHAEDTLPYGITKTKLVPVIHSGSIIGTDVPVWDIAQQFG